MKLNTLIFSKNRACQLELLLRSLGNFHVSVLYFHDPKFKKGYQKVQKMYPKVNFIKENNFKSQLTKFVENSEFILFLTDDSVAINPIDPNLPEFKEFKEDESVVSLSLSLSTKVAGHKWEWAKFRGNYRFRMWGYPMSVDSCVFRSAGILPVITGNKVTTPNFLETYLNLNIPSRPFMLCLKTPVIINNSVNQVQKDFPQSTIGPTPLELEERFLSGVRLSLDDIKAKAVNAKTYRIKVPYEFENYESN